MATTPTQAADISTPVVGAGDGHHHLGLHDRLGRQGLAFVPALEHRPAALAVRVDLLVAPLAIPLRSVVVLLVGSAVSGLLLGSEATLAVLLQAHLEAAQALAQGDLVLVLLAHLRAQGDPTVVLQQEVRREVHPVQDRERRSNPPSAGE